MELSVREWLILIGVLLIVVVLLDAIRRFRSERRNTIRLAKISFGAGGGFDDSRGETFSSELPNGGARVIRRNGAPSPTPPKARNSQAPGPVGRPGQRVEPHIGAPPEMDEPEPRLESADADDDDHDRSAVPEVSRDAGGDNAPEHDAEPEEVFVINVISGDDQPFKGPDLLQVLLACDVRFGSMNIFHRYEEGHGKGPIQFSIANAVEPGTFDLDRIDDFATPGISMFMQLPGPRDPEAAFDCMLETARCIVRNLGGEVRDARHSPMNRQTVELSRSRVREYAQRGVAEHTS